MRRRPWVVLSAMALSTGCGPGVRTKVADAMSGCMAVRNPLFTAGKPEQALAIPMPAALDTLARQTAYSFGLIVYQETADAAETQAEVTCALELGSRYESEDTRAWLEYFTRHPNAPVAAHARKLLDTQLALIGKRSD